MSRIDPTLCSRSFNRGSSWFAEKWCWFLLKLSSGWSVLLLGSSMSMSFSRFVAVCTSRDAFVFSLGAHCSEADTWDLSAKSVDVGSLTSVLTVVPATSSSGPNNHDGKPKSSVNEDERGIHVSLAICWCQELIRVIIYFDSLNFRYNVTLFYHLCDENNLWITITFHSEVVDAVVQIL